MYVFATSNLGITLQRGSGLENTPMLTMLVRLLIGGRCLVGRLCAWGMRVLVFEISEVREAFDDIIRVRSTC